jgi:hypothetical protein
MKWMKKEDKNRHKLKRAMQEHGSKIFMLGICWALNILSTLADVLLISL